MGFGSEGSLVLKHHDHRKLFSNKDLEVRIISIKTFHPLPLCLIEIVRGGCRETKVHLYQFHCPRRSSQPSDSDSDRGASNSPGKSECGWYCQTHGYVSHGIPDSHGAEFSMGVIFPFKLNFQEIKTSSHLLFRYFGIFNVRYLTLRMFTSDSNLCWKSLQNGSFMTTPNNTILIRAFIVFYLCYQVRYWLHNTGFIFKERISLEELEAALRLSIMSSSLWHDWDHLAGFMAEIPASTARCWRETRATRDSEPRDSDKSSSAISGNNRNEKIKKIYLNE